ncbi:MAG TPA: hypothetical protein VEI04_03745 [Syntrophobacteria bacterium]|nr:hypothetical protein [Syntrophobacteria bacterium]
MFLTNKAYRVSAAGAGLATVEAKPAARTSAMNAWLGVLVALLARSLAWMIGSAEAPEIELAEVEQARML